MHRVFSLLLGVLFVTALVFAQESGTKKTVTMKGYVLDKMCGEGMVKKGNAMQKAAGHSKDCALSENCAASGFGIISDGKWVKFTEGTDKDAKAALEKSKRAKGMYYEVSGTMEGDQLALASIKEATPAKAMTGKKEMKESKEAK
jgi:hypothetical protein